MQIGTLSRKTGVSIRMLRYYEQQGLLQPRRTEGGYRSYDEADVQQVNRILLLNTAGLTLDAIRPLLPCALPGQPGTELCQALKDRIRLQLHDLDRQITALSESRKLLRSYLQPMTTGSAGV